MGILDPKASHCDLVSQCPQPLRGLGFFSFLRSFLMQRVILFIDGFNLYHAIMEPRALRKYRWLDFHKLGESLLSSRQKLVDVFFFTAFYPGDTAKRNRHQNFIRAQELNGVKTVLGRFRRKEKHCKNCREITIGFEEKETDVNIAIELFRQAVLDTYDSAFVLSGDSDLIPAIRAIKDTFPAKTIKVILPPFRRSEDLKNQAHSHMQLKEKHLRLNQFPDSIRVDGVTIDKPPTW